MSDVSTVKAEIKAWERSFKASNGRDPNVNDIKDIPDIAAKYRLYKKLSKSTATSLVKSSSVHTSPPSTPPRSRPRTHQLVQPRVIETTAPLSSFNPFSPQKNKGKERESSLKLRPNPPTSPFKQKPPPHDTFPALDLPTSSTTPSRSPPAASSALSRARKRLRGDPVSPSPNKEKRRRISSQFFTNLAPDSSESEADDEVQTNLSFVSPVKAPSGARSFKLLFDEAAEKGAPVSAIGRTKTHSASRGLFGAGSISGHDDDALWDISSKAKATLFKASSALPSGESIHTPKAKALPQMQAKKRPLSYSDAEVDNPPQRLPAASATLIPPSPPLAEASTNRQKQFSNNTNTKGKGKAGVVRCKKAKTSADDKMDAHDEGSDDDSDSFHVKVVNRTQARFNTQALHGPGDESDSDPILGYSHRVAPRGHEAQGEQEGKLDVDLPDKLRRVLALDTADLKARDSREERLVKGLVLGQRAGHYDPIKGGEIWDVGEDDARLDGNEETRRDTEGEDDWEGEPVPWEVGEL
ncbi:hypothetical protein C0991_009237 [Blastosporella zonata]|nr:hypothetical protein C0991_009237 [Blastosporella zonata]